VHIPVSDSLIELVADSVQSLVADSVQSLVADSVQSLVQKQSSIGIGISGDWAQVSGWYWQEMSYRATAFVSELLVV